VYTPPNVAKGGCNMFDPNTGKKSHIKKCGYYSAYGQLLKE
jgi:cysteine dioxygenase